MLSDNLGRSWIIIYIFILFLSQFYVYWNYTVSFLSAAQINNFVFSAFAIHKVCKTLTVPQTRCLVWHSVINSQCLCDCMCLYMPGQYITDYIWASIQKQSIWLISLELYIYYHYSRAKLLQFELIIYFISTNNWGFYELIGFLLNFKNTSITLSL